MLVPKKLKYRKPHRGKMRGQAKGGTDVQFGEYGLQALEPAWITNRQIEAARIAMTRKIKSIYALTSQSPDLWWPIQVCSPCAVNENHRGAFHLLFSMREIV